MVPVRVRPHSEATMNVSQHWNEQVKNAADEAAKLVQMWDDRSTLDNLRLDERYREGALHLIVHGVIERGSHTAHFCAVFRKHVTAEVANVEATPTDGMGKLKPGRCDGCAEQDSVLVEIVDDAERPESVVPSLVRLQ